MLILATSQYLVTTEYEDIKNVKWLYHRCESIIEYSSGKIDDVSNENIENMILDGKLSILENKNKMLDFYQKTKK